MGRCFFPPRATAVESTGTRQARGREISRMARLPFEYVRKGFDGTPE